MLSVHANLTINTQLHTVTTGYNPPWTPSWLRTNEVAVVVKSNPKK
jgi:hypothetical protein